MKKLFRLCCKFLVGERHNVFTGFITKKSTRQAGDFAVIAFCEDKQWKRNSLRKEQKVSAVKQGSTRKNIGWMRRT